MLDKNERRKLYSKYIGFYIFLMIVYMILTALAVYMFFRLKIIMHRYIQDKYIGEFDEKANGF
jgi:hypothetical protein